MYCGECAEGTAEALDALSKISGIYKYSYEVSVIFGLSCLKNEIHTEIFSFVSGLFIIEGSMIRFITPLRFRNP